MYRLNNKGMSERIDWLIKNRDLLKKEIIIYPHNEEGIACSSYIEEKYGIKQGKKFIDDKFASFNTEYLKKEDSVTHRDSFFLIFAANTDGWNFWQFLSDNEISMENVFILSGNELLSQDALIKCCENKNIRTVLDVGCGRGDHANIFLYYGKETTGIDACFPYEIKEKNFTFIKGDFEKYDFSGKKI